MDTVVYADSDDDEFQLEWSDETAKQQHIVELLRRQADMQKIDLEAKIAIAHNGLQDFLNNRYKAPCNGENVTLPENPYKKEKKSKRNHREDIEKLEKKKNLWSKIKNFFKTKEEVANAEDHRSLQRNLEKEIYQIIEMSINSKSTDNLSNLSSNFEINETDYHNDNDNENDNVPSTSSKCS